MNWRLLLTASVFASVVAASGCGGGGSTATTPSAAPSSPTITIQGQNGTQAFTPNPALFGGQAVVFKNNDVTTHHIVLNDGSMTTGDIAAGASSAPQAMGTGTGDALKYHCTIHPGMVGGFNGVTADPPPNCNQAYC